MRTLSLCFLALSACAVPSVDLPFDSDRDGLLDDEEADLGTDPDVYDSDGDAWGDGDEFENNTDPGDPDDHPYTGGWAIDSCRDSVLATGNSVGMITDNFDLGDQFGDGVKLHDFCGKVVLLEASAFW